MLKQSPDLLTCLPRFIGRILLGSSSEFRLLVINLALPAGRQVQLQAVPQLVNFPTAQSPGHCRKS